MNYGIKLQNLDIILTNLHFIILKEMLTSINGITIF